MVPLCGVVIRSTFTGFLHQLGALGTNVERAKRTGHGDQTLMTDICQRGGQGKQRRIGSAAGSTCSGMQISATKINTDAGCTTWSLELRCEIMKRYQTKYWFAAPRSLLLLSSRGGNPFSIRQQQPFHARHPVSTLATEYIVQHLRSTNVSNRPQNICLARRQSPSCSASPLVREDVQELAMPLVMGPSSTGEKKGTRPWQGRQKSTPRWLSHPGTVPCAWSLAWVTLESRSSRDSGMSGRRAMRSAGALPVAVTSQLLLMVALGQGQGIPPRSSPQEPLRDHSTSGQSLAAPHMTEPV